MMMKIACKDRHTKRAKFTRAKAHISPLLSCHFCGNCWDCKNRCFVCPKCHTVYNPLKRPLIGFGGELRVARQRENLSQTELGEKFGLSGMEISNIERGKATLDHIQTKILKEKLRIWIESTKSPIDRRSEIENMFNSKEKEAENG